MQEPIVDATVVEDDAEPGGVQSLRADHPQDEYERNPSAPAPGSALVPSGSTALIDARGPRELVRKATKIADELHAIIVAQGFRVDMNRGRGQPRWHIEVEGWQTLATLLGLAPLLRDGYPRPLGPPVRYTARVEHYEGRGDQRRLARITTYEVDGHSYEAIVDVYRGPVLLSSAKGRCDRTEERWARADEYAVASMAHTRATSRAVKQAAGWIVALAGYQTTPAAEVDVRTESGPPYGPPAAPDLEARVRRAVAWLLAVPRRTDGEPVDEEAFELVQDAVTALVGEADGYLPHVLARGVIRLAADVKTHRQPAQERAASQPPAGETR